MNVAGTIAECRRVRGQWSGPVGFVPTMGALHAGHMSLVAEARKRAARVVVSIFVNPTQFGPSEDFSLYPRPIDKDLDLCRAGGVDMVFHPTPEEIYPHGEPRVTVDVPDLSGTLEGTHRPGHFRGVCQVVCKLLNIVQPTVACFGQKDFQQLRVIEAMVRGLDMPVEIVGCPTVREPHGLAMSSRNAYLGTVDRDRSNEISRALFDAVKRVAAGERDSEPIIAAVRSRLEAASMIIDYVAVVDRQTLFPARRIDAPAVLVVAARCGRTRLIDNVELTP